MNKTPFFLAPQFRDYMWGGSRLRPLIVPTAEAWVIYAENRVSSGPYNGRLLVELAEKFGIDLIGSRAVEKKTGKRFPVLVKLLDCAEWLSLQVHPNDQQALALEGQGFFGKTEAWHILEAEPNAILMAGVRPQVSEQALQQAIRSRDASILNLLQTMPVQAGDTLYISPGTIHALGPGLLVYEIQQTSDLTYRVYDWGRPETEPRRLHTDKALASSNAHAHPAVLPLPPGNDGERKTLAQGEYFQLEMLFAGQKMITLDTRGESFHGLTVIEGQVQVSAEDETFLLKKFDTLLIPACGGEYRIEPLIKSRILKAGI